MSCADSSMSMRKLPINFVRVAPPKRASGAELIALKKLMVAPLFVGVVLGLLLLLFCFLDGHGVVLRRYKRWKLVRKIPLAYWFKYHWLLGHIPELCKLDERNLLRSLEEINRPCNKDKDLFRFSIGFNTFISIIRPNTLTEVLKQPKSTMVYSILIPWLGEGLLVAEGKKWFRNRRLLTPAFHYEILKGYMSVYNSCLSVLLDKWSKSAKKGEPVLLFQTLGCMSLDIIMQSALSFKSDCQEVKVQHPYVKACGELVYLVANRMMNPLYMIDCLYWLTPHGRKTKNRCDFVHDHAEKIIAERKTSLSGRLQEEESKRRKHLDFLDILLLAKDEEGKGMSDLEIRNEVDTFMFEGHDTTTSAMSWTLYCLAQHPQHQDKIREEVKNVLMGKERLDYDDLKQLNYTTWCIKEAMRLYPPVFEFYRVATEDIPVGDLIIPRDAAITIPTFMFHHNVNIWENPMEYDPLRFQPSNMEKHGPYDYIPFSAGSRNCIGQNFAMNEMKTVIGTIVSRFSLKVDESHHVEMVPQVILRAKNDIKLYLISQ